MVGDVVWALVLVSSAVVLVSTSWVLVALFTVVSVGTASELGQIAAVVALELDVAQAVLLAHVLRANAHVLQPATLAHELFLTHTITLLIFLIISKILVLAVHIATEKRIMAALAFIKLTDGQGVLERFLVESICWVVQSRVVLELAVLFKLLESIPGKSALEDSHFSDFCYDLWNGVMTVHILLATGALHEVERNTLCAPTVAKKLSEAVGVEDVSAIELQAGLLTKRTTADVAVVKLSGFVGGSALDFEAGQVIVFSLSFAAAASVAAIKFMSAGADLRYWLELGDSASLGKHHCEELLLCLSVDEVFLCASTIDTNEISDFNHLLF